MKPADKTNKQTGKRNASVQLLAFGGYRAPILSTIIRFNTFFSFIGRRPPLFILFTLTITYHTVYRDLQEEVRNETSNCTIDDNENKESEDGSPVKYNCIAPKLNNTEASNVEILPDIRLNGNEVVSTDEISYTEEAALGAANLQLKDKAINSMYSLDEATVQTFNKYFIIRGKMNKDYNGQTNDALKLTLYDNRTNPAIQHEIDCIINGVTVAERIYEIRCDPKGIVNGILFKAPLVDLSNNSISINTTDSKNDIFTFEPHETDGNTTIPIKRGDYRKASSGLSGGAIAGIVIACAVVLIIASIVAVMLRKPAIPVDNSTSVVGLRTIDNYSQ